MPDNIFLSICIPTYNRAQEVFKCVCAWLDFEIPWIEVIVSDNASDDDTEQVLASVGDRRFKYFRNKQNTGYNNIFQCITYATGEYILLC